MLTARTPVLLGRWGTRDFLRGRGKKGGAIHIRHTHGSKGRFKRLSTLHGIRDGRRHAGNRLKGGLGVKLGGGLLGLRIPRQHALSTMTREQFDLEVYGHPNITNPYRELMAEHPALREVMANAAPRTEVVLLLPRALRNMGRHAAAAAESEKQQASNGIIDEGSSNVDNSGDDDSNAATGSTTRCDVASGAPGLGPIPPQWRAAAHGLLASLHVSRPCVSTIYLCTVDCGIRVPVDMLLSSSSSSSLATAVACQMDEGLSRLYAEYCRGLKLSSPEAAVGAGGRPASAAAFSTTSSATLLPGMSHSAMLRKPFLGAALRVRSSSSSSPSTTLLRAGTGVATTSPTALNSGGSGNRKMAKLDALSAASARAIKATPLSTATAPTEAAAAAPTRTVTVVRLDGTPSRECCVAKDTVEAPPLVTSGGTAYHTTTTTTTLLDRKSSSSTGNDVGGVAEVWRRLKHQYPESLCLCLRPQTLRCGGQVPTAMMPSTMADGITSSTTPTTTTTATTTARPLLKKDADTDERVGVWRRHPRTAASALFKWFYSTHDPRAHSRDAIPHHQRRLPVILLVDASRLQTTQATRIDSSGNDADKKAERDPHQETVEEMCVSASTTALSLLSHQLSEELDRIGFHAVGSTATTTTPTTAAAAAVTSLDEVARALASWTTERQWNIMLALREEADSNDDDDDGEYEYEGGRFSDPSADVVGGRAVRDSPRRRRRHTRPEPSHGSGGGGVACEATH